MIERTVTGDQDGQRVDKFLRRLFSQVPQSHLYKLLRLRRVRVNGLRAREDTLLKAGDRIVIRGDEEKLLAPKVALVTQAIPRLNVLFEDADLLAVDKPAGLAVHPGSGIDGDTLVELARAHVGSVPVGTFKASPAHRLDRDTSGIVVVAKTRKAMVRLTELFTAGSVQKRYLALVKGRMDQPRGTIDLPLAEHEQTARSRAKLGIKLQTAVTHWESLGEGAQATLVACRIETGRTHQIRRHMAAIGHPLVGDRRHGDFAFNRVLKSEIGLGRMFLHAERLTLSHPTRGGELALFAPLPAELADALEALGLAAPPPPSSGGWLPS